MRELRESREAEIKKNFWDQGSTALRNSNALVSKRRTLLSLKVVNIYYITLVPLTPNKDEIFSGSLDFVTSRAHTL